MNKSSNKSSKRSEYQTVGESNWNPSALNCDDLGRPSVTSETTEIINYSSQGLAKLCRETKEKKRDLKEKLKLKEKLRAVKETTHIMNDFDNEAFKNLSIEKMPNKEGGSLSSANTNAYNFPQPENINLQNNEIKVNAFNHVEENETKIVIPNLGNQAERCRQSFQQQSNFQDFKPESYINSNHI